MTAEHWRPVPGWAGYEVSDLGRVRSIERVLPDGRRAGGVELAQHPDRDGYLRVVLRQADVRWNATVHLLVKLAFTGPRRGREIRHLNDVPTDNRLTNLRYGTRRQNRADRKRNEARRRNGTTGREQYGKREIGEIGRWFPSVDDWCRPVSRGGEPEPPDAA